MRIVMMYYVDFYSLFEHPESDWETIFEQKKPLQNQIFLGEGLTKTKTDRMKPIYLDSISYSVVSISLPDSNNKKRPMPFGVITYGVFFGGVIPLVLVMWATS